MADKRISQLVERTDIANNDVVPIVASGATTTNKATISSIQEFMQENLDLGVTSVGVTISQTDGQPISVTGSPITTSGNITINLPRATDSIRGLLDSEDFINFSNKQPAGNYVTLDTAQTITAQKTFSTSGGSDTAIINHGSGSGVALNITKGGNGEGLRVTKTSGSGNAVTITGGNFEAGTIVKTGGTSSQFLKADGSVDSNSYVTLDTTQTITGQKTFTAGRTNFTNNDFFQAELTNAPSSTKLNLGAGTNIGYIASSGELRFNTNYPTDTLASPKLTIANNGQATFTGNVTSNGTLTSRTLTNTEPNLLLSRNNADNGFGVIRVLDGGTISFENGPTGATQTSRLSLDGTTGAATLTGALNGTSASFTGDVQTSTRLIATNSSNSIILTPNLAGTTNRIESLNLPLEIFTSGSELKLRAGAGNAQVILASTGALTLTGALNGTSASFSGQLTYSSANNRFITNTSGATTGYVVNSLSNTGNSLFYGIENSAGNGIGWTGGPLAYSAFFGSTDNRAVHLMSNSAVRLTVAGDGSVGIGTASPTTKLHVIGSALFNNSSFGTASIRLLGVGASTGLDILADSNDGYLWNRDSGNLYFGTSNAERMRITSGGDVEIAGGGNSGTLFGSTLYSNGQIYLRVNGTQNMVLTRANSDGKMLIFYKDSTEVGSISTNANSLPSDLNFKKNINTLDLGLNLVTKLRPVSYNHKIDDDDAALSTGLIAQEFEDSLIELGVDKNKYYILQHIPNEDETQSQYWVDYTKIVPILIKAIQEQQIQIDSLKNQIK